MRVKRSPSERIHPGGQSKLNLKEKSWIAAQSLAMTKTKNMDNNKTQKTIMTVVGILVAIFVLAGIYLTLTSKPKTYSAEQIKTLAQCLTDKGFAMYGTDSCTHCKDQKAEFGESFSLINFTECIKNEPVCTAKGIMLYPTWITNTGEKIEILLQVSKRMCCVHTKVTYVKEHMCIMYILNTTLYN